MEKLDHTDYSLANLAGVSMPDNHDSPGARFLLGVQDAVNESITWTLEHGEELVDQEDTAHEIADNAVPIYTYEKWQTFVDLAAWQEDPTDLGYDGSNMDKAADVCLYVIAERLALVLFEEVANAEEESP